MYALQSLESVESCLQSILEQVDPPLHHVALESGRSVAIAPTADGDRIEVRGRQGEVVLRILVGENGPILSFESAAIEVQSRGDLSLSGRNVHLSAANDLRVDVGGVQHTRVAGPSRLEAETVELQANDGDFSIRAREDVKVDAERIGLNDNPLPQPFAWSAPASEP